MKYEIGKWYYNDTEMILTNGDLFAPKVFLIIGKTSCCYSACVFHDICKGRLLITGSVYSICGYRDGKSIFHEITKEFLKEQNIL